MFEAQRYSPQGCLNSGFIAIIINNNAGRITPGLGYLLGSKAGTHRGGNIPDTSLIERSKISIAFDQDEFSHPSDLFFGEVETIKQAAFNESLSLRGVEVFGLSVKDGSTPKGHHPTGQSENRKDNPPPKAVTKFSALLAAQNQTGFFQILGAVAGFKGIIK